jgi:hypothetical protein
MAAIEVFGRSWLSTGTTEADGSRIEMVLSLKTVSLRPIGVPGLGRCWHPASRATRTGVKVRETNN